MVKLNGLAFRMAVQLEGEKKIHKKFLLFSCLVFLVAVVYFIYTTFKLRFLNEVHQHRVQESKQDFRRYIPRADFSNLGQKQLSSHEREEREEMLEQTLLTSPEKSEDAGFIYSPKIELNENGLNSEIDPELVMLFVVVNEWRDKNVAHGEQISPLMNEYAKLSRAEGDLLLAIDGTSGEENRRLDEELRRVQSEKESIAKQMDPYDREMERITQEFEEYLETNYGLTIAAFFKSYGEEFDSWRNAQ